MGTKTLYCPFCKAALSRITRRQDYFCRACHSVVEVVDDGQVVVQRDMRVPEVKLPIEQLHPEGDDAS